MGDHLGLLQVGARVSQQPYEELEYEQMSNPPSEPKPHTLQDDSDEASATSFFRTHAPGSTLAEGHPPAGFGDSESAGTIADSHPPAGLDSNSEDVEEAE